jgi:UDP-N-acetylmuramoyl-tripeptide--D-alanyl-D-alanine ligase
MTPGAVFFALKGERFDGNQFVEDALEKGAAAVVTTRSDVASPRVITVPDTLKALQALALKHRRTFTFPVLALGGSNGKTTTKELLKAVLSRSFRVYATPGNYNNHIGVPLTLLSTPLDSEILIVELGANHLRETAFLCQIAEPQYGLVTNTGKDHLEGFGNEENVARANAELYAYLRERGGLAFVNGGDATLMRHSEGLCRVYYGAAHTLAWAESVAASGLQPAFTLMPGKKSVSLKVFGCHNLTNALAAAAVGRFFGVPLMAITEALSSYIPVSNRSAIVAWQGATVVADCYNANPSSMEAALREFAGLAPAPRFAILADMLELGPFADKEHENILRLAVSFPNLGLALTGRHFKKAAETLQIEVPLFETTEELKAWFSRHDWNGYHLLLKGSRLFALEKLLQAS